MATIKQINVGGTSYDIKATYDGSGNTISSTYLKLSGGTMAGALNTKGTDIVLGTSGTDSNDSGDLVWNYGDGGEKMRLWSANDYTAKSGPYFRVYNDAGTQLYSGTLPLGDGTGASGTWGISISGSAAKLGTSTVGSTRRPIYLNGGTATEGNYTIAHLGNAGKSNMNDVGRMYASSGMTNLTSTGNADTPRNGTSYSSSWHLYWDTCYTDDPNGSNSWAAQIVNKAGTDAWWVRSRAGGTITNGTAWQSTWRHLVTSTEAAVGSATNPVYVNANGEVTAALKITSGTGAPSGGSNGDVYIQYS